ncbi:MAG TPA: methylated-DNA--[protein]-cysteine S-methyltransferase [Gemmatimonadales bacterium]|nr:methylated-DNA--[protein]-cysteine S-methyltransferase [Gemmatimonadales bacterium]
MSQRIRFTTCKCTLGYILVGVGKSGICAILLGNEPVGLVADLQARYPTATLVRKRGSLAKIGVQVRETIESPATHLPLALDPGGTAFQQRVWRALRQIPAGSTATYSDIALRIGAPRAVRAVARACGANPVAVAIPCHRIVRRDGSLAGYRWGTNRKRELLRREALA